MSGWRNFILWEKHTLMYLILTVLCVCVLATQSHLTLCNSMDCSPPGSSVHGDSPGKNTGVGCHSLLQGIFPIQGSNPGLLHCRQFLYSLNCQESPILTMWKSSETNFMGLKLTAVPSVHICLSFLISQILTTLQHILLSLPQIALCVALGYILWNVIHMIHNVNVPLVSQIFL